MFRRLLNRFFFRKRIAFAALLEQGRREEESAVEYRPDQRARAIEQRLSRHLGKRAAKRVAKKLSKVL